ncbi:MAG: helix-turn-helix transcriptional regulator [Candidatus Aminicenantaceae bacterium]|nr:helix-turn-helix transcriptional regulator [Candidatus Heimdallarchaeota archaeon]
MKKYFFTEQIDKKFRSVDDLPEWLSNYPDFKDQIKLLRETLGMTQEQLGKKVNRSLRSIQQIESGEAKPKISTLYKIAEALNTELRITLIPRENIIEFLNEKATKKAEQLVKLTETSSALEIQTPSKEERDVQIDELRREILDKRRSSLWNQNRRKK